MSATSEPVDLLAVVADLQATVAALRAEVAQLRADRRADDPMPLSASAPAASSTPAPPSDQVDRRGAIKRAGVLAAGAVAGGAAIVAATASPAAAATVTGSGAPGVRAQGLSGDGIDATADANAKSAVYAHTGTAGAFGVYALHTGDGNAIYASSTGTSTHNVVEIHATGPNPVFGLDVQSSHTTAAYFLGGNSFAPAVDVAGGGTGSTLRAKSLGSPGPAVEAVAFDGGIAVKGYGGAHGVIGSGTEYGVTASGDVAAIRIVQGATTPPPAQTTSHTNGELAYDGIDIWLCVAGGTPGSWRRVAGPTTAGSLVVLPSPVRVYDSRPGTAPSVGPKTPLVSNVARAIDLKANSSTVPAGATAALVTLLLVNAASGNGNVTLWANGVAKPSANTLVWGGSTGRFTAKELSALDSQARVQVSSSLKTDVVIDVVGYYR